MYRTRLLLIWVAQLLALALLSWSAVIPEVSAQSLPSTCRPAGGNLECTRVFVSPYRFSAGTCSVPSVQPSESAAWDKFMEPSHHHCIVSVTDIGRLSPSSPNFSVPCGGNGSYSSRIEHYGDVVQDNRLADCTDRRTTRCAARLTCDRERWDSVVAIIVPRVSSEL